MRSAPAAEGSEQLDDLLRVAARLAGAGAEAKPVQFLADLRVRHAPLSKFDGLRRHVRVHGTQRLRYHVLGLPRLAGRRRSGRSGVFQAGLVNFMHSTANVFVNDDEAGLHHDFGA
jgi:hypothetical protein